MKSKFSTILFICILFLYNIYANEINDVRKKLIETTNHILSIERENIELSNSNMLTQQHEKKELLEIFHHKKVGQILKNLRRAQESSPLLMALSNHSIDNLIKTAMLIKVLKPQLDKKYSSLLSQFKLISKNRSELESNTKKIEANKERILNLEKKQEELLNIKYRLFFKTSHNPNLEKFAKEHSLSNENNLPSQNFDDLVHQLQTLLLLKRGNQPKN